MRSGELRHRVAFQLPTAGVWAMKFSRWCKVTTASGSEDQNLRTGYGVTNWRIKMRKTSAVTTKHHAIYNSRTLNVEAIMPDKTDARYQIVDCTEVKA